MTDDAGHESGDDDGDGEEAVDPDLRERIEDDPFCATLGIDLVALEPGYAEATMTVTEGLLNFHGHPHGGAINALADAAFAAASNSHGDDAVALETNISYLDTVAVGDTLRATARETHLTRRTGEYEIVVRGAPSAPDGSSGQGSREGGDRVATFRGRVYRP